MTDDGRILEDIVVNSASVPTPRKAMNVLLIADRAPDLGVSAGEYVKTNAIDLVVTAGDLYAFELQEIANSGVPMLGVYGNHCDGEYMAKLGITNLHRNKVTVANTSFVGLEGCVRYKPDPGAIMYTQDEYSQMIAELPAADVLVTHCPPRGVNDHTDHAHIGIDALPAWLDQNEPSVLVHGHTYPSKPAAHYGKTRVVYVHGARVIGLL